MKEALTILIWIAAVLLWTVKGWWFIVAGLLLLHIVELFIAGLRTGRENGKSVGFSVLMTLVFGVVWWKPLKDKSK